MRIYTIEPTNHCNAGCEYCPQPMMKRERGYMTMETFKKIISKQELGFAEFSGFGEPMLHPNIYDFIKLAKNRGLKTQISTNGLLLNETSMDKLVNAGLDLMWVSIRPYFDIVVPKLKKLYDAYSEKIDIVTCYVEYSEKARPLPRHWKTLHITPHTWSSQVDLTFRKSDIHCFNLANKAVSVLWDGRISNCCHDVEGNYILGVIDDDTLEPRVTDLCRRCEFGKKR